MTCPACGEAASSRLPIFNEEGTASGEPGTVVRGLEGRLGDRGKAAHAAIFPHVRVEPCDTCRPYLLSTDLLSHPPPSPLLAHITLLPPHHSPTPTRLPK